LGICRDGPLWVDGQARRVIQAPKLEPRKQCRRIATRYDKLAANYLAFIQLASIRLWLRVNESTP
jgi:transposase